MRHYIEHQMLHEREILVICSFPRSQDDSSPDRISKESYLKWCYLLCFKVCLLSSWCMYGCMRLQLTGSTLK